MSAFLSSLCIDATVIGTIYNNCCFVSLFGVRKMWSAMKNITNTLYHIAKLFQSRKSRFAKHATLNSTLISFEQDCRSFLKLKCFNINKIYLIFNVIFRSYFSTCNTHTLKLELSIFIFNNTLLDILIVTFQLFLYPYDIIVHTIY